MSNVSKNTIKKYMELVSTAGRVWTESELVSFRSLINTKLRHETDVRDMLVERFNASLDIVPFKLEGGHQIKGLQWLRKTQLNKSGLPRAASTTFIGIHELTVLQQFHSIELAGLRDVASASAYRAFTPVYRVIGFSGASFDYSQNSCGAFEVTDIRYARGA